jgi:ssDNA-binding Zn-finger/Zn-ribbon topoisomerase 1
MKPPINDATPKVVGVCSKCGGNLVERRGKSGVFVRCANFLNCKGRAGIVRFTGTQKGVN